MRRFLIAANEDGERDGFAKLCTLVQKRRPDGVLLVGSNAAGNGASHAEKRQMWEDLFDALGKPGVFTAMVPGAGEAPLREFLRLAKDAEVEYPNVHVAHATLFEQNDVAVCGLGGELTEAEDRSEDRLCYSRSSAEYYLRSLWQAEQPHKVLLLSAAPPGPLGGKTGNRICGDFIDSYHPSLCVVAGTTERRGVERIAHTLVVNPGRLSDGAVALLDWTRSRNEQVELLPV
jgi:Icc-related predicted phosphoesterase